MEKEYKEIHFEEIDSTNKYIKEHHSELTNLTFVRADFQSAGRGRYDRQWISEKGESLLFSFLLKDEDVVRKAGYLSFVAASSVVRTLYKFATLNHVFDSKWVSIKWPNDIYIGDKKVCGILLESQVPDYAVIGIGINVNQKEFKGEYRTAPTSIAMEFGKEVDLESLKEKIFSDLAFYFTRIDFLHKDSMQFFDHHDYLKKKAVRFVRDGVEYSGIVKGVNDEFELLIEVKGEIVPVSSGEIDIIK